MSDLKIKHTTATDQHFIKLVKELDEELAVTDGEEHSFYDQFNKLDSIKHVVVLFENDLPVSCGAIKHYDDKTAEVKRMYTSRESRGKGYAAKILAELEQWAGELGYERCILETGINQPEAIRLYHKTGYLRFPNYGQYTGVEKSFCFEKLLKK
ncbi:GNAT family N-acetyltransferase [Salinimicrobium xinjiangense]|uniref:GNAT family N-acetyltransferase n=1 Tax=Salinimicrobium xinjiangense TaxID=438596 RepID=UPI0004226AA1|nr:GNAT family N-acetyltransferase [Salinimicrobium xinjiangense]